MSVAKRLCANAVSHLPTALLPPQASIITITHTPKHLLSNAQIIDVVDCTGSGDIDTSKVVTADEDGCITGGSGDGGFGWTG